MKKKLYVSWSLYQGCPTCAWSACSQTTLLVLTNLCFLPLVQSVICRLIDITIVPSPAYTYCYRALGDNPLHCDCRLTWLATMIKVRTSSQLSVMKTVICRNKTRWTSAKQNVLLLHTWSANLCSMFQTTTLFVPVMVNIIDNLFPQTMFA